MQGGNVGGRKSVLTRGWLLAPDSFPPERWQVLHIATGDILRVAIVSKTAPGIRACAHGEAGELVDDQYIEDAVEEQDLDRLVFCRAGSSSTCAGKWFRVELVSPISPCWMMIRWL